MKIAALLTKASKKLALAHFETPQLDAEVILSKVTKKPREYLLAHSDQELSPSQKRKFEKLINRRLKNEPVAYLVNKKWFYGLEFYVDKRVLIPRPETETLCEEALKIIKNGQVSSIIDIGTGSGNIILTLAKLINPKIKLWATDVSKKALSVAKKNAKKLGLKNRVKFIKSDLFEKVKGKFDLIIANLPYVPENLKINTGEPRIALYCGETGYELYQKFFKQIKNFINKQGRIIVEIDSPSHQEIKKIILDNLPESKVYIKKDLAALNRSVVIKTN